MSYEYALGYRSLDRYYDSLFALTMPEPEMRITLERRLDANRGERVLDIGCGTGTFLIRLVEHVRDVTAIGVDGDEQILKIARRKADIARAAIEWRVADAGQLPFAAEFFDAVVSSMAFHHLYPETKRAALSEAYRVLRPGGRLLIMDFGKPQGALQRFGFKVAHLFEAHKTTRENAEGKMPELVADAGFTDVGDSWTRNCMWGTLVLTQARKP